MQLVEVFSQDSFQLFLKNQYENPIFKFLIFDAPHIFADIFWKLEYIFRDSSLRPWCFVDNLHTFLCTPTKETSHKLFLKLLCKILAGKIIWSLILIMVRPIKTLQKSREIKFSNRKITFWFLSFKKSCDWFIVSAHLSNFPLASPPDSNQ